ncbi:MAG: type IV conjugative transfer system protein TraL [Deltaproteobacteria bacterium]|nr:type IV conjugative transfer system protein TraL [Deltaproteobacteria bacterium]
MSDVTEHAIPSRLDDPERWLFRTLDEAAVLLGPAVLGLAANAFVTGLVAGSGHGHSCAGRSAAGAPTWRFARSNWFLPDFAAGFRGAPPSHLRRFVG